MDGETTYNPYRSAVPEFVSDYSQTFEFDSDGLGNMVSKTSAETVSPQKTVGDNLNYGFEYVYDENYAHRLVRAGDRFYQYDANGNVTCEQDASAPKAQTSITSYNANDGQSPAYGSFEDNGDDDAYHKVTKEADGVYSTDYGWGLFKDEDERGHGASAARYRRTYTWDEKNRLISSVDANYSTSYVYGHDGQRSNKYTQSSETLYFNKMWTLHTDSGNSVYGGQTAKNIYLGETRIVTKLNSGSDPTYQEEYYKQYYYHGDHLGSASLISDYKGDEYQRIEYTPYGETWVEKTANTGLEFLPYKFTAKELDKETGLYYYGARYLDPKYSRWISTDPALGEYIPSAPTDEEARRRNQNLPGMGGVFNAVNASLYHYAGNNPVKYTDPDGRIAFCAVTALIGAGIGAGLAAYKSYQDTGKLDGWKVLEGAVIGGAVGLGLGLVGAELATSTALSSGNALASFSAVTGYGASSTVVGTTATSTAIAVVESPSSSKLAQNLINEGISKPAQTAAHHIVAGGAKNAEQARFILAKFGIGINDAANGVFLPQNLSSANPNGATVHSTLHTIDYYERVNAMLGDCRSKQEVIKTLQNIRNNLMSGEF